MGFEILVGAVIAGASAGMAAAATFSVMTAVAIGMAAGAMTLIASTVGAPKHRKYKAQIMR